MADQSFSIVQVLESIAVELAPMANQRLLQITSFSQPDLPEWIKGDPETIKAILLFLGKRAIRGLSQGAVLVEALPEPNLQQDIVRFCISDSRTEIVDVDLSKMRDQMLAEDTGYGGTLDELLKRIDSKLLFDKLVTGRSTRFFFPMVIRRASGEPVDQPISEKLKSAKMFLVANDPPPNRAIQQYCRHSGFHLEGAPTAAEALVVFAEHDARDEPFELVAVAPPIEDMLAPELAKTIRQSDITQPKLLYIAEWDDDDLRKKALDAGFDAVVAKPFGKVELFAAMHALLHTKMPKRKPLVLVVEDNPINAKLALFQLRAIGYEAEIVTNGKEAVDAVDNGEYIAVLMDLQMPIMNGIEATKVIREREKKSGDRLPIIALTANDEWRAEAMAAGCDLFLTKPAKKEDLNAALESLTVKASQ